MRYIWSIYLLLYALSCTAQVQQDKGSNQSLSILLQQVESEHQVIFSYRDRNIADYKIQLLEDSYELDQILAQLKLQTQLDFQKIDATHIVIVPSKKQRTRIICGYIKDKITNEPLHYANVYVHESSNGTETDLNGYFELEIPNGAQVSFSFLGYTDININTLLSINGNCPEYYIEQNHELKEVIVTEYLFDGIRQDGDAHDIIIEPDNLNIMPGSIEGDILSAIQFLPGIYSTSESFNSIHMRGGTPDQNLILWDGIPMYHTSHFFGNISAFNPVVIDEVNVHRSAIASEYGGRVSGVIDISSRDSVPDEFDIGVSANMTHVGIHSEIPLWDNAGLIISSRSSLTQDWASPTFNNYAEKVFQGTKLENSDFSITGLDIQNRFQFNDASLKFLYTPGKNKFVLSSIGGLNELDYYSDVPNYNAYSVDNLNIKNGGFSIQWERKWSNRLSSQLELTNSYYKYDYALVFELIDQDIEPPVKYTSSNLINDDGVKLNFDYRLSDTQQLKFGTQNTENHINLQLFKKEFGSEESSDLDNYNNLNSLYGEYALSLPGVLKLDLGLRYQYQSVIKNNYFEPRIALVTDVSKHIKLKASTSKQFQFISQLVVLDINDLNLSNQVWVASNNKTIPVIESNQWTGGIVYNNKSWTIDVEGYVKELVGITSLTSNLGDLTNQPYSRGNSRIRGIDLLVKKRVKNYRSWVSYTLSETKYEFPNISESSFPSSHDHRQILQWVNLYQKSNFEFSLSTQLRSGQPFTQASGVGLRTNNNGIEVPFVQYEDINSDRLKNYMRLDGSVSYHFGSEDGFHGLAVLSIQNLSNQSNILGKSYLLEPRVDGTDLPDLLEVQERGLKWTPNIGINLWW